MFFFFNDTATTEIYTLSLHDALPIFRQIRDALREQRDLDLGRAGITGPPGKLLYDICFLDCSKTHAATLFRLRSEEHTSELQSRQYLVCRLLLEKKNQSPERTLRHIP